MIWSVSNLSITEDQLGLSICFTLVCQDSHCLFAFYFLPSFNLIHEPPNRIRPLAARLFSTRLPPTLSCLLKNPCLRLFLTIDGWKVRLINHVDKSRRRDCRLPTIDVLVAMVKAPTWLFWGINFEREGNWSNFANLIAAHGFEDAHGPKKFICPAEAVFICLAALAAAWFSSDVCNREVRVKRDIMNVCAVLMYWWCKQEGSTKIYQ